MLARLVSLGLLFVFSSLLAQPPESDSILKVSVGDLAPKFELKDFTGNRVALSEFRGRKFVVLAFYVFAFTQGCGDELTTLQKRISEPDTQIIGISMDSIFANVAFASQIGVSYPLLSDKGGIVTRRYGLFNPSIYAARRATFVIDKNGKIVDIQLDHEALNVNKTAQALEQLRKRNAQPGGEWTKELEKSRTP